MEKSKATRLRVLFGALFFFFAAFFMLQGKEVFAATPLTLNKVDYDNEDIILNNNGNTKIYFASELDANKENWEVLDADTGSTTSIDFSWLSPSSDNVLIFKGEEDGTWVRVTIMKQIRKLSVTISYADIASLGETDTIAPLLNIMTSAGTAAVPINYNDLEWKKGDEGKWLDVDDLTVAQLEKYQIMGTVLFFRIKAVNDTTDGTKGRRPSTEVRLGISRKAPAVPVGVDGSRFTAAIKYGNEYRISVNGSAYTHWTKVLNLRNDPLKLEDILNAAGYTANGITSAFPKFTLQSRTFATSRAAASKISSIKLSAQRTFPGIIKKGSLPSSPTAADLNNVYISYNGVKTISIIIPNASSSLPYEYCIQKPDETFDSQRAAWSQIATSNSIKILASKAVDGGILHIRQKLIKTTSSFTLASTQATYTIDYPYAPTIARTSLTFTKGYSNSLSFDVTLNTANKDLYERRITSIKLGTKEIGFTVDRNITDTDSVNISQVNKLTVSLLKDSLEAMPNCYNRTLIITYANGTVDRSSVQLTIQNPVLSGSLSLTAGKGSATGTTAIRNSTAVSSGDKLVYTIGSSEVTGKYTSDTMTSGVLFTSGADITGVAANQYVTVYEVDGSDYIIRCKSIKITADYIK